MQENPNLIISRNNDSLLHVAAMLGISIDMTREIDQLLSAGANPLAENNDGLLPVEINPWNQRLRDATQLQSFVERRTDLADRIRNLGIPELL